MEVECVDTGLDTPTGGRIARWRSGSGGDASASPMPTGSPTSTSSALLDFHREPGAAGHGDRRSARTCSGAWPRSAATTRSRASSRSRAASTGSTAASSASSRARWTTSARTACSSASRWSAWPPTAELGAYRHEGFWDCMDTYKDAVELNDLWCGGRAALADLGRDGGEPVSALARHRRPWLRRLAPGAGAARAGRRGRVPRPARSAPPTSAGSASGLDLLGLRDEVELRRGRPARRRRGRGGGRRRRRRSSTWRRRRSSASPANPRWRRLKSTCAAPGTSSRPAASTGRASRLRLLRQGLRRQPRAALPRGLPAACRLPL